MQEELSCAELPSNAENPDTRAIDENEILAHWRDTASAPVLPPAAGYLLSALYADDISLRDVPEKLERFPSIAARLLAVANSAWSSPTVQITRLSDACTRLGLDLVRTLSVGMAVANSFDPQKCSGFNSEQYWMTALVAADGTTRLARGMHCGDDAMTWRSAALFHNIGLLWFADRYPQAVSEALVCDDGNDLAQRMRRILGIDYCRAGGWLANIWELPDVYASVVEYHRDPEGAGEHALAAATVGVAADMAACLYREEAWTPERIPACAASRISAELAQSTLDYLTVVLDKAREMGQTIAAA